MADVTQPPGNDAFDQIMRRYPVDMQALAYGARALIYAVYPAVVEIAWVQQGNTGYGVGPKKMTEHFSWISVHKNHVNLGFFRGTELPDPHGLLEGTGKLLRHVKIRTPEDLENPHLRMLLEQAVQERITALKIS